MFMTVKSFNCRSRSWSEIFQDSSSSYPRPQWTASCVSASSRTSRTQSGRSKSSLIPSSSSWSSATPISLLSCKVWQARTGLSCWILKTTSILILRGKRSRKGLTWTSWSTMLAATTGRLPWTQAPIKKRITVIQSLTMSSRKLTRMIAKCRLRTWPEVTWIQRTLWCREISRQTRLLEDNKTRLLNLQFENYHQRWALVKTSLAKVQILEKRKTTDFRVILISTNQKLRNKRYRT